MVKYELGHPLGRVQIEIDRQQPIEYGLLAVRTPGPPICSQQSGS